MSRRGKLSVRSGHSERRSVSLLNNDRRLASIGNVVRLEIEDRGAHGEVVICRLDLGLPYFACGARDEGPVLIPSGSLQITIAWRGLPRVTLEGRGDSGTPFHPYLDPESGEWSEGDPERTHNVTSLVEEVLCDLCYSFAPQRLYRDRIMNRRAAEWYEAQVAAEPSFFASRLTAELVKVGRRRLQLLEEAASGYRSRLKLLEESEGYEPEIQAFPPHLSERDGFTSLQSGKTGRDHYLVLRGKAVIKLTDHIGWGTSTRENQIEQGGLLLGRVYKDRERGLVYGVAEDMVPSRLARGSSTHLHFSAEAWREMLDEAEKLGGGRGVFRVIGWYHTHPGELQVFMSGTDCDTQRQLFFEDWHFSVVLNPQREVFRVFYGPNARECSGYLDRNPLKTRSKEDYSAERVGEETEMKEAVNRESPPSSTRPNDRQAGSRGDSAAAPTGRPRWIWPYLAGMLTGLAFALAWILWDARRSDSGPPLAKKPELQAPPGTSWIELRSELAHTVLEGTDGRGEPIELRIPPGLALEVLGDEKDGFLPVQISVEGKVPAEDVVPRSAKQ